MDLEKLRWPENEDDSNLWRDKWTSAFKQKPREPIRKSQELATEMAHLARQIREQVKSVFEYEVPDGPLHRLFNNFKEVLIHDLDIKKFADMYAQTITYGLFSARAAHEKDFFMEDISAMIPNTNPFLKNLFEECTKSGETDLNKLDLEELGIAELIAMLKDTNIENVLQEFGRQRKGEDPVVHFYELFLEKYDSKQKIKRGVFYTPDPVVSFIVRSVDYLLQTEFDLPDGLADTSTVSITGGNSTIQREKVPKVQILDPALGTGTFLKHVIERIRETFEEKNKEVNEEKLREKWKNYVSDHLLPKLFGFELMMAPYTVSHLKIGLELAETGYDLKSGKRVGIYLTNTLEGTRENIAPLDVHFNWLAREGNEANVIKTKNQITIVIGNPPYSGHSENKSDWIADLLRGKIPSGARRSSYFEVDGEPLGEKNPKWLNDDYVKFIRFGQWRVDKTGQGILAFITGHGYLDNPTFRGMRQQLMESFTDIYLLDLHGNTKKKESCPDGSKDENVFDIQQGVAIGIFVKNPKKKDQINVYHADLWGLREQKYEELSREQVNTIEWEKLSPSPQFYLFKPQDTELRDEYEKGWKITDIMPVNSVGIVTARDKLTIQDTPERVWEVITDFSDLPEEVARKKYNLGEDSEDWKVKSAQADLRNSGLDRNRLIPILYRPFDVKYTYYTGKSSGFLCRPRPNVMQHMIRENLGLIFHKREELLIPYSHFLVISEIIEHGALSSKTTCYLAPLYIYSKMSYRRLFTHRIDEKLKSPNIKREFLVTLSNFYGQEPTPEAIFHYIYAIFYSPEYRTRYSEFLKMDFPKVPFTSNYKLFSELSKLGEELVSLHLMHSDKLEDFITTFEGEGNNEIGSIGKRSYRNGKLHINRTQYFNGIPGEVYNFYIGGYQICQKWLKDRKGQKLTNQEVTHYQKIIVAINETIQIMKKIDTEIEKYGGWPIK